VLDVELSKHVEGDSYPLGYPHPYYYPLILA
jgi:hypothetical protein